MFNTQTVCVYFDYMYDPLKVSRARNIIDHLSWPNYLTFLCQLNNFASEEKGGADGFTLDEYDDHIGMCLDGEDDEITHTSFGTPNSVESIGDRSMSSKHSDEEVLPFNEVHSTMKSRILVASFDHNNNDTFKLILRMHDPTNPHFVTILYVHLCAHLYTHIISRLRA